MKIIRRILSIFSNRGYGASTADSRSTRKTGSILDVVPILNNAVVNDFEGQTELAPAEACPNIRMSDILARPAGRRKTPALYTMENSNENGINITLFFI